MVLRRERIEIGLHKLANHRFRFIERVLRRKCEMIIYLLFKIPCTPPNDVSILFLYRIVFSRESFFNKNPTNNASADHLLMNSRVRRPTKRTINNACDDCNAWPTREFAKTCPFSVGIFSMPDDDDFSFISPMNERRRRRKTTHVARNEFWSVISLQISRFFFFFSFFRRFTQCLKSTRSLSMTFDLMNDVLNTRKRFRLNYCGWINTEQFTVGPKNPFLSNGL